jgi:hypothetical protein
VKGKLPHSGGHRIRELEDVSQLVVRWAVTGRPSAAEEELHRAYRAKFGCRPSIHTQRLTAIRVSDTVLLRFGSVGHHHPCRW